MEDDGPTRYTRILYSGKINSGKYAQLQELAWRLGNLRTEVWRRFGSLNGVPRRHREVRDEWLAQGRQFDVPARLWKETLRDSMANIKAYRAAVKKKVQRRIKHHTSDKKEQKRLFGFLKYRRWLQDSYLLRIMRRYWNRGHNHTFNQIVLDTGCYDTYEHKGRVWLKVSGLQRGKRIAIPLTTTVAPTGTLRLILKEGRAEVHYTPPTAEQKPCGTETVGIDKGYTEAFTDDDNERYGEGLGEMLSKESDSLKTKYQRRNKLRAIAEKKPHKAEKIRKNNLGRKKLNRRRDGHTAHVKDHLFKAAHALVDKAKKIACEDLTLPIKSKNNYGKNQTRRLTAWVKGLMMEALLGVSHRRGSAVVLVNASWTSQIDSRNGFLIGKRKGDRFYCYDGAVLDADQNAARTVKARLSDPEIDLWTPYQKVRSILLERTERAIRMGLLIPDSSCSLN